MKFLLLFVAVLVAVALSTPADAKSSQGKYGFEQRALAQHNFYRKKHGVPPLSLDPKLTRVAQDWANHLAQSDQFEHNPATHNVYGENIYYTYSPQVDGKDAVDSWYKESKVYKDYNNDPLLSGYPDFLKIGHFTQVVWKDTTKVGVAKAKSKSGRTYVVADYSPPGNYKGMFVANVLPPKV